MLPGEISRYCSGCGRELGGQERFCPQCGTPRHGCGAWPDPYASGPLPNGPTYQGRGAYGAPTHRPAGPAARRNGGPLGLVMILSVMVICGLFIFNAGAIAAFLGLTGEPEVDGDLEMGNGSVEYYWTYDRHAYTLLVNIGNDVYSAYRQDDVDRGPFSDDEAVGICQTFVTSCDAVIVDISSTISDMARERGLTNEGAINLALAFVQSIEYASDEATAGHDEYWRYPVETLYERAGDCEDKSFLFASVIEAMGYDAVILLFDDHMAVGVACPGASGTYYSMGGSKYFYCETTAVDDWELGRAPEEYDSAHVVQVE